MSIAEEIKNSYKDEEYISMLDEAEIACEGEPDQDYDNETTTYYFADGSKLVWCNGDIYAYGVE